MLMPAAAVPINQQPTGLGQHNTGTPLPTTLLARCTLTHTLSCVPHKPVVCLGVCGHQLQRRPAVQHCSLQQLCNSLRIAPIQQQPIKHTTNLPPTSGPGAGGCSRAATAAAADRLVRVVACACVCCCCCPFCLQLLISFQVGCGPIGWATAKGSGGRGKWEGSKRK